MRPGKVFEDQIGKATGCETPEYRRMTKAPEPKPAQGADKYITISVAEYHWLTKAATMLEAAIHAQMHDRHAVIEAAQKILAFPEAGAGQ